MRYPGPELPRFLAKVSPEPNTGCWLWMASSNPQGYGSFRIRGGRERTHRTSWRLHRGPIPAGLDVLHKCDVPGCVNPEHLFVGDDAMNMADMVAKGRNKPHRGLANGSAKYPPGVIDRIRSEHAAGVSSNELSRRLGVSLSHVSRIVRGLARMET